MNFLYKNLYSAPNLTIAILKGAWSKLDFFFCKALTSLKEKESRSSGAKVEEL